MSSIVSGMQRCGTLFVFFLVLASPAKAVDVPPSPDGCGLAGQPCLTFIDFDVYSLSLLQEFQSVLGVFDGFDFVEKPNEADVTIFDTDGNGTKDQGKNTDIDDAFKAVTGGSGTNQDNMMFVMTSEDSTSGGSDIPSDPEPNGDAATLPWDNNLNPAATINNSATYIAGDQFGDKPEDFMSADCLTDFDASGCIQLWDADIEALAAAIDDPNTDIQESLAFFFINNDTGDDGELFGKDVLAWGKVTVHNCEDGDSNCADQMSFFFGGDPGTQDGQQWDPQTAGVDDILPTSADYWAHVHSDVCLNDGSVNPLLTGAVYLGSCADAESMLGWASQATNPVDQSLGVDEAGFMAISTDLNTAFFSGDYKYITIDVRFSHLNNGGDVLWIGGVSLPSDCPPDNPLCNQVPIPGTLLLFGVGLFGLGVVRRRRISPVPLG